MMRARARDNIMSEESVKTHGVHEALCGTDSRQKRIWDKLGQVAVRPSKLGEKSNKQDQLQVQRLRTSSKYKRVCSKTRGAADTNRWTRIAMNTHFARPKVQTKVVPCLSLLARVAMPPHTRFLGRREKGSECKGRDSVYMCLYQMRVPTLTHYGFSIWCLLYMLFVSLIIFVFVFTNKEVSNS